MFSNATFDLVALGSTSLFVKNSNIWSLVAIFRTEHWSVTSHIFCKRLIKFVNIHFYMVFLEKNSIFASSRLSSAHLSLIFNTYLGAVISAKYVMFSDPAAFISQNALPVLNNGAQCFFSYQDKIRTVCLASSGSFFSYDHSQLQASTTSFHFYYAHHVVSS